MNPKILINSIKAAVFMALFTPLFMNDEIKNIFYFPFVAPKSLYFMALAEIAFFSWLVLAWRWKQFRISLKNPVVGAAVLFLAASFLAAILGADFANSFWSKFERMGGILMLAHLTAFMIAAAAVLEKRDWERVFWTTAAIATIVGLQAVFNQAPETRGGGFLGNDSFLGTYLLFNIFIGLRLFVSRAETKLKSKKTLAAAAIFCLPVFCLFFAGTQLFLGISTGHFEYPKNGLLRDVIDSGSRAAKIAFLAGMALLGFLRLIINKNKTIRKAALVFCAVAIAAGLLAFSGGGILRDAAQSFGKAAVGSRLAVWSMAWQGFLERPILGWGPENFDLVFARHFNPCIGSPECGTALWYDRAHNVVLDTLVETGAVGFAAYLAIFAAALFVLWRGYFSGRTDFAAAGIFTALLAAYFLQNLTVFDMVCSYLMFYLCLAFIAGLRESEDRFKKIWPAPLSPASALVPAILFVICLSVFVFGPADASRGLIEASRQPYGSAKRIEVSKNALEASPLGRYQARLFLASQWLAAADETEKVRQLDPQLVDETFAFCESELKKNIGESPLNLQSRLELGRLYDKWSVFSDKKDEKLAAAAETLTRAAEISPKNQQSYWELAQTRIYQAKPEEALEYARQALDLYPQNTRSQKTIKEIERIKSIIEAEK